ncbi:PIN domain-containing protein [bacterium]|nr:PIN domain-containing protein [bacterium]
MKKVIFDTNLLISFITDRNPDQQEMAALFFEQAARLKHEAICHLNVVAEFVHVMDRVYDIDKDKTNEMISDLMGMPGVQIIGEVDLKTVLKIWPSTIVDYGDALLAAVSIQHRKAEIATFDEKFKMALSKLSLPLYGF